MQSVSSRIWNRVAAFIFYDDNHYTTGTSTHIYIDRERERRYTLKTILSKCVFTSPYFSTYFCVFRQIIYFSTADLAKCLCLIICTLFRYILIVFQQKNWKFTATNVFLNTLSLALEGYLFKNKPYELSLVHVVTESNFYTCIHQIS